MSDTVVDARGEVCPKPLIMTKKALKGGGGAFRVLLDNRTSFENVSRFLGDNGISFEPVDRGDEFVISVSPAGGELTHPDAASYCAPEPAREARGAYVIAFGRDRMGEGPEELGRILIQGFCNTIGETDPLPETLVFYNSGVQLARGSSPTADSIAALAERGVKILVCGTCADYFDIKDDIPVGTISNMYTILETLARAGHVVSP